MSIEPVVLIEANSLLREGLKRILVDGGFEILHSVGRVSELPAELPATEGLKVVLRVSDAAHIPQGVSEVLDRVGSAVVVVLGDKAGLDVTFQALMSGACAYLDDVTDCDALYKSIELASEGRAVVSLDRSRDRGCVLPQTRDFGLSEPGLPAPLPSYPNGRHDRVSLAENAEAKGTVGSGQVSGSVRGDAEAQVGDVEVFKAERNHGESGESAPSLSPRESAILDLLREGAPNKVIARRLSLTESTVKVHLKAILRKIRVKNRTQAAVWAIKRDETGSGKSGDKKQVSRLPEHSLQQ